MSVTLSEYPCRPVRFGDVGVQVEERPDGVLIVSPKAALEPHERNLLRRFWRHGDTQPDRDWVVERGADGAWARLTYGQARDQVSSIAAWLRGLAPAPDRSVLVLSENSRGHAVFMFGAMAAGVPICSVSVNYALLSTDFERLRHVVDLVRPAVILAERGAFARAVAAVAPADAVVVSAEPHAFAGRAVALSEVLGQPDVRTAGRWIEALIPRRRLDTC